MKQANKFSIIIPPQDIACEPGLLKKLANGDRDAFDWVYKNYSKKVYDYAMLLTRDETLSDDVVQDIFLRLWNGKQNLKNVQYFNTYLKVMVKNLIATLLETKGKHTKHINKYYYSSDKFAYQSDTKTEFWCDEIQLIKKGIEQLPPQQMIVYKLRREDELSRIEIAEQLNISVFTVKNHLQKSLRFLKEYVLSNLEN